MGERVENDGFLVCPGDATEEGTLVSAGLHRCKGVILTLPSEADNVYVTLLAKDTIDIKAIVYEMRFDPVSVRYGEFGDFYIGMQMPLDELFRRLCL